MFYLENLMYILELRRHIKLVSDSLASCCQKHKLPSDLRSAMATHSIFSMTQSQTRNSFSKDRVICKGRHSIAPN